MFSPPVFGFVIALGTVFATVPVAQLFVAQPATPFHAFAAVAAGIWWVPSLWAALQVSRGVRPMASAVVVGGGWLVIGSAVLIATAMPWVLIAWLAMAALLVVSYRRARAV